MPPPPTPALVVTTPADLAVASKPTPTVFSSVPRIPPDPMEELIARFMADDNPMKLNLAVGAYRNEAGRPYPLRCAVEAERMMAHSEGLNHEYLPFKGLPSFVAAMPAFIFGADSRAVREKRVYTVQTLSGSGALRVAAELLNKYFPADTPIYFSDPTWPNHVHIFHHQCGRPWRSYRYLDRKALALDIDGMLADLGAAPDRSIVLLQACAHNPTGVDPTAAQWRAIVDLCAAKGHFVIFDAAYQGFATGDVDRDAGAMRYAEAAGLEMMACHSFSKTAGLYNERIGALSIVLAQSWLSELVEGQLKSIIRLMYLSPPAHGAGVVTALLTDDSLASAWKVELAEMIARIAAMRRALVDRLTTFSTPHPSGTWDHVAAQIGMFAYTGLSAAQVDYLESEHHIFLTRDGRLNVAAIGNADVERVARALHRAVEAVPF